MKDLRAVILTFLATTALVGASAGTAFAREAEIANSCATDGAADQGDEAVTTDQDPLSNNDVIDEGNLDGESQNGNNENKNDDCGETGDAQNDTAGAATAGTNQNGKSDRQTGDHDDGKK